MSEPFRIIAQTEHFWLLDKAAGVSFHSEQEPGLVVLAEQQLAEKLYPVHRLDKVTSGLILLARTAHAAAALTEQFTLGAVDKYYLALSASKPQKKQGWVKGQMVAARRGSWRLTQSTSQAAVTYFLSQGFETLPFRAFLLKPYTGKTHQLRVALKSVSAPILGDQLYGGQISDRTYLHAYQLCFNLFGQDFTFQSLPQQGAAFSQLLALGLPSDWYDPAKLRWPLLVSPQALINNRIDDV